MHTFVQWLLKNGAAALLTAFFCCMESNIRKCGKVLAFLDSTRFQETAIREKYPVLPYGSFIG